jgi:hypothetical protein
MERMEKRLWDVTYGERQVFGVRLKSRPQLKE